MVLTVDSKQFWAEGSGLLPIRLSPIMDKAQYILLDGGLYDFCLDLTSEDLSIAEYYSAAWSSNVKNYIAIREEHAIVYNWAKQQSEKVKLSLIQDKFQTFLKILNNNSYRTSDDVTPFILGLFAKLRNLTHERQEPTEALNLLFKLLISLDENNLSQAVCDKWKIENVVEPAGFDILQETISQGVRKIHPNLDYILRHGSGPLFETAHREAIYFDQQLNLFGGISSNLGYASQQKYSGVHYTPRYLVRSVVENALRNIDLTKQSLTILDPACGSGAFLQEVLKQLREKDYPGEIIIKGFDISPIAELTAKFLLNYENRSQWNNRIKINIQRQDSLDLDWENNDLILMNPPFVSYELIKDAGTKDIVNQILEPVRMKKRPNMAAAFLYKAVHSRSANGVLGAILPSSILNLEQYQPMRKKIQEMMNVEIIAQLGNYVFNDALTDTSFILAKNEAATYHNPLTIWCSNREQSAFNAMKGWRKMQIEQSTQRITDNYNIFNPSHFPLVRDSWKVLSLADDQFLQQVSVHMHNGSLKPLESVCHVRQGIIKGNKDLFVIDQLQYEKLNKTEKRLYRPLASSQTIVSGHVNEGNYIWYPYSQSGLIIRSEKELEKYECSYEWLRPHKDSLLKRKKVNNWWELTCPRTELFSHTERMLCSKRSGGAHSFAIIPGSYVVEEGNIFLFDNSVYWEEDKYFYLAFFSSSLFQHLLSIYARPLKAGYDMGNAQIKDIPIIDVSKPGFRESKEYRALVTLGKEYNEGSLVWRDKFDKYVLALY